MLLIGFKWLIHRSTFTRIWRGASFVGKEGKQRLRMWQAHFWVPVNTSICNMEYKWWWSPGKWRLENRRAQSSATRTQKQAKTMALNNLKSQSWGGIKGVILWIRIIAGLVIRVVGGRESVCWGEAVWWSGQRGARHHRVWLCLFGHQNKRPSSKRRNLAHCPGQGCMVYTVLLMPTPLQKLRLKGSLCVSTAPRSLGYLHWLSSRHAPQGFRWHSSWCSSSPYPWSGSAGFPMGAVFWCPLT